MFTIWKSHFTPRKSRK